MKKIILLVVGVVFTAGVGFGVYSLVYKSSDDSTRTVVGGVSTKKFNPVNSANSQFVATTTIEGGSGPVTSTTVEHDGKDAWLSKTTVNGTTSQALFTKDAYYTNIAGQWFKSSSVKAFASDSYELTPAKLAEFQAAVKDKGSASCPSGTCELWEAENYKGNDKLSFYVRSDNKIDQLVTVIKGKTIKIGYEYKPVTITIPTDAKTLPSLPTQSN